MISMVFGMPMRKVGTNIFSARVISRWGKGVCVRTARSCGRSRSCGIGWQNPKVPHSSEKLMRETSCNATGIKVGQSSLRMDRGRVDGLGSSAVAEMLCMRVLVDVFTYVHQTHALLGGLQVSMG